jgi:hypothetical protein
MSTLARTRLRLAADAASFDAPLDVLRRATPQFWRGNDVQWEIALFFNGALLDVSNLASLTLEVRPLGANGHAPDPSFVPLMGATITSFDNTTTLDNWNAGTNQQALVVFTAAQSNITAGAAWLSIFAITNDSPGRVITFCAGPVRVLEDGAGLATTPTPTADTFYTAAESDARFAPVGAGAGATASTSNPLMDGAAAPGTATTYTRADHVHPSDTSRAPLTSPALTGTPTAPTVGSASDSTTKLATTAFVQAAIAAGGGGTWGSITGTLSSQTDLNTALNSKAALVGAAFTGAVSITRAFSETGPASIDGLILANSNAAFSGGSIAPSPQLHFKGYGWNGASTAIEYFIYVSPGGAGSPPSLFSSSCLQIDVSTGGGLGLHAVSLSTTGDLTLAGGITALAATFTGAVSVTGQIAATNSTGAHLFINSVPHGTAGTVDNYNCITMRAVDSDRDSAFRCLDDYNTEVGAGGHGNSTNGGPWQSYMFFASSNSYSESTGLPTTTLPGGIGLILEGNYSGNQTYYRRMEINGDGSVNFCLPNFYNVGGGKSSTSAYGSSIPQFSLPAPLAASYTIATLYNYGTDANSFGEYAVTTNDGTNGGLAVYNSTYSYHAYPAAGLGVVCGGAGGIALIANNASGIIKFLTGGDQNANEAMRIDASGNIIIAGANPSTFTRSAVTGGFPAGAANELLLQNNLSGANVLAVQNLNSSGYSAYTARTADGHEVFAMGTGNGATTSIFQGTNYLQSWSGVSGVGNPPRLIFTMDGDYGPNGTGFRFYQRQSFETNGEINFWKQIGYVNGTEQMPSLIIDGEGTGTQFVKVYQDANSDTVEWWKDSTPSHALAIGLNLPGSGVLGNDMVFSTYNGSAWSERLRILNSSGSAVFSGTARLANYTVSSLPSASTEGAGATAFVTDASTTATLGLGTTVAGGGSNKVPVYSDGTNWIIG